MTKVDLQGVTKRWHKKRIVNHVDLTIKSGQITTILGDSKSGQSTLLRIIAGLEKLSSGDVLMAGESILHLPASKRQVVLVTGNNDLYPHFTVAANIAYRMQLQGVSKETVKEKVEFIAEQFQIVEFLKTKPQELTFLNQFLVILARAMVDKPKLLLFDNPFADLSLEDRISIRTTLYRFQHELNLTCLFATTEQSEAMMLADHLMVMREGEVAQFGKPLDVYQHPMNSFVASSLGSPTLNMLSGDVSDSGRVINLLGRYPFSLPDYTLGGYDGQKVIVGIRPEMLHIPHGKEVDQFRVRVKVVELLGAKTVVHGLIINSEHAIVALLPGNIRTHAGEVLILSVKPNHLAFFDEDTKERIIPL